MNAQDLTGALADLTRLLPEVQFPLPIDDAPELRASTVALADQLRDYLLPRAERLDAPLLAVVGGSTGAGKSTLVNSILGAALTQPGVLRPTTRSPVLVCNPHDLDWFSSDHILPGMIRSRTRGIDSRALQIVPFDGVTPGMALLDAPDIDSVDDANRRLARQLLQAADLWLFVTSAARYADLVGWEVLGQAIARNAVIGVVLNRCPPESMADLKSHLSEMLTDRGLPRARLFAVAENARLAEGMLPGAEVEPIRAWLRALTEESRSRADVAVQTLAGSVGALDATLRHMAHGAWRQVEAVDHLRDAARREFRLAQSDIGRATSDGTLLRGEVLARWQDFVGTGEFMRGVEQQISKWRDRITGWFTGSDRAEGVQVAITDSLAAVVVEHAETACQRTASDWRGTEWGRWLLQAGPALEQPSAGFRENAERMIRDWQAGVLRLVGDEGRGKRMKARFLALGTNAVGAALIILTFATTGGLTTAEIGIAGGTSLLAQRLLEGVFGEDAVRRLAQRAKQDLDDRVEVLLAGELARFEEVCDGLGVERATGGRLKQIADRLAAAARRAFSDLTRPEGF